MEYYINKPAQRTVPEIFFNALKYNNYSMPAQNYDRKQKITFQTNNLFREKCHYRYPCNLNERHITHKSCWGLPLHHDFAQHLHPRRMEGKGQEAGNRMLSQKVPKL